MDLPLPDSAQINSFLEALNLLYPNISVSCILNFALMNLHQSSFVYIYVCIL